MIDLTRRRVLVTGGSRGIGAACCRLFARAGAAVLVQHRASAELAAGLLDEMARSSPSVPDERHLAFRCDLTHPAEVRSLFAFAAERWGGLDCLVNNAAVWLRDPLANLDGEAFAHTLALNLAAPFFCAHEALPLLRGSPDGNIVNLSSTAGQRGEAFYSAYAATKGALIAATKSWATELAPAIRVNAVAPGWVATDMTAEALAGGQLAEAAASIPLGRVAEPEDIAGPVVFLASPLARHITGEILNVNGGSVLAG